MIGRTYSLKSTSNRIDRFFFFFFFLETFLVLVQSYNDPRQRQNVHKRWTSLKVRKVYRPKRLWQFSSTLYFCMSIIWTVTHHEVVKVKYFVNFPNERSGVNNLQHRCNYFIFLSLFYWKKYFDMYWTCIQRILIYKFRDLWQNQKRFVVLSIKKS